MAGIVFTAIEADVLRHRLGYLAGLDADDLDGIFPTHDSPSDLALAAELASGQLYDGRLVVANAHPDTLLVLVEAIEGATIHELASEATQGGKISRQKQLDYLQALVTAADKIERAAGRAVQTP
ncbi:MAG: hypothetical protein R3260_00120 [Pseudomonas sp.]|nr:hypothetical protein [Pseudomonas sp.]